MFYYTPSDLTGGSTFSMNAKTRNVLRLHLGCGLVTPSTWVNIDGSWNARFSKQPLLRRVLRRLRVIPKQAADVAWAKSVYYHDLRKPLPFPSESVREIYSSHTLEHLYHTEAISLLRECWRVLIPGGIVRLVVPDLEHIILGYTQGKMLSTQEEAAELANTVNRRLLMHLESPPTANPFLLVYRTLYDLHSHKWMYDAASLIYLMQQSGFIDVEQREYLDSRITDIKDLEQSSRVLDGAGVCVEGIK